MAAAVFRPDLAFVSGSWAGQFGHFGLTVRNVLPDNFAPVAGDGIDDLWQMEYFDQDGDGQLLGVEATSALPDKDPDGDGQSNQFEFLVGNSPVAGDSRLTVRLVRGLDDLFSLTLSQVVPGVRYSVRRAEAIEEPMIWETVVEGFSVELKADDVELLREMLVETARFYQVQASRNE